MSMRVPGTGLPLMHASKERMCTEYGKDNRINMFGDIVIKSRPLRFAFLIPPENAMLRVDADQLHFVGRHLLSDRSSLRARPQIVEVIIPLRVCT